MSNTTYYDDVDCDGDIDDIGETLHSELKSKLHETRMRRMEPWYNILLTVIVFLFVLCRGDLTWAIFSAFAVSMALEKNFILNAICYDFFLYNKKRTQ